MQQDKDIESVFAEAHVRSCPKGQIVLYQGEKTQNVFRISKGYVKVYDITSQGEEKLVLILGPEDLFPVVWTFGTSDSLHYFYETMNDTELSFVSRKVIREAVGKSHALSIHLLEYFVERTKDLMLRIDCIESTSAKHKVAQVLLYLANSHGKLIAKDMMKVQLPITHQAVANMSGINRATASTCLKELEDERMFKAKKNSYIIHTDRLEKFLET